MALSITELKSYFEVWQQSQIASNGSLNRLEEELVKSRGILNTTILSILFLYLQDEKKETSFMDPYFLQDKAYIAGRCMGYLDYLAEIFAQSPAFLGVDTSGLKELITQYQDVLILKPYHEINRHKPTIDWIGRAVCGEFIERVNDEHPEINYQVLKEYLWEWEQSALNEPPSEVEARIVREFSDEIDFIAYINLWGSTMSALPNYEMSSEEINQYFMAFYGGRFQLFEYFYTTFPEAFDVNHARFNQLVYPFCNWWPELRI